ncbi:hypothetical protein TSMEX_001867 [Taenia solium]|eukprot:TsM_000400700 transcript=TsM_000400700 gene=TsM_000400700
MLDTQKNINNISNTNFAVTLRKPLLLTNHIARWQPSRTCALFSTLASMKHSLRTREAKKGVWVKTRIKAYQRGSNEESSLTSDTT